MKVTKEKLQDMVITHHQALEEKGASDTLCWGWGAQKIEKAERGERCAVCGQGIRVANVMEGGGRYCAACAFLSPDHLDHCLVALEVAERVEGFNDL